METKTKNSSTTSKPTRAKRPSAPSIPAADKVQAVLAVWTNRCTAAEVCRQMKVRFMTFHQWQSRAMEGMLQALESRVNLAKGEALSPRLRALLSSRQNKLNTRKLSARLERIQLASRREDGAQEP